MSTIEQRSKEVLSTRPAPELVAFMILIGAEEALKDTATLTAMRGTFAGANMSCVDVATMLVDVRRNFEAMSRATENLTASLEGLLDEFPLLEENKNSD
ncbi:hydroxymethylglutaryl-CoA reductase [Vibrio phage 70E35.2]|nr:hydroxymethylglutaryl-CoA reductase [Vibrio phage 70E35.2]